jgi:hypothetical protein
MKLVERETGLPLDLVILINNFLYERLTDENLNKQSLFGLRMKRNVDSGLVTSATGKPQESQIWEVHLCIEKNFTKTLVVGMFVM